MSPGYDEIEMALKRVEDHRYVPRRCPPQEQGIAECPQEDRDHLFTGTIEAGEGDT